jgi:hypothetical protein
MYYFPSIQIEEKTIVLANILIFINADNYINININNKINNISFFIEYVHKVFDLVNSYLFPKNFF